MTANRALLERLDALTEAVRANTSALQEAASARDATPRRRQARHSVKDFERQAIRAMTAALEDGYPFAVADASELPAVVAAMKPRAQTLEDVNRELGWLISRLAKHKIAVDGVLFEREGVDRDGVRWLFRRGDSAPKVTSPRHRDAKSRKSESLCR